MFGVDSVTLEDVHRAAHRLRDHLPPTPLVHSARHRAWLKLESMQTTGAYKVRGALNALCCQIERGDRRTVIAASAGNHGAGVAWAARRLGLDARIVVPVDAPRTKIERIRSEGAEVSERGDSFEESYAWAIHEGHRRGWRFLHAFDDPDVIAGQGTIALELLSMRPELVLVPIGGGGLASGVSVVLRAAGIPVIGVQITGVDAMASTLRGGPTRIDPEETVADGLRVREPGWLTRELCRSLDDLLLVSESEVRWAMRTLALRDGLRVEGAGAVAVAGLEYVRGCRTVALVTGGNVDPTVLSDVLVTPEPRVATRGPRSEF